jgi:hypothetical protein
VPAVAQGPWSRHRSFGLLLRARWKETARGSPCQANSALALAAAGVPAAAQCSAAGRFARLEIANRAPISTPRVVARTRNLRKGERSCIHPC